MANMAGYSSHHLQALAQHGTASTILCCMCSASIQQNPANMCVSCLRQSVDITDGINRKLTLHSCRGCGRFLCPPWQSLQLESKELLAACLRKIPGLNRVKLIDAVWIWTEPHSMRLKIKITVQKEVMNGAILQQAALIEFTIRNQQCKNCEASYAQGVWHAVVQVRQRVNHKRTFFFLEQLLLKHGAHSDTINIVTYKDGMDFYFKDRQPAVRFLDFLSHHVPVKSKYARKLVSADHKDNVGDFKHNYMVEIVPVCKDDLVILPRPLAASLSDAAPLCTVRAVGAEIHVVDFLTGERHEISSEKYWRWEFTPVMSSKQLVPYIVLSVEFIVKEARPSARKRGAGRKIHLAECTVAKESDFGRNDTTYNCITHLGYVLREGDTVLGFDIAGAAWAQDPEIASTATRGSSGSGSLPDVILVRKKYPTRGQRLWALRQLEVDERAAVSAREAEEAEADYEDFMQQVEGDREMRSQMRLYRAGGGGGAGGEAAAGSGGAKLKASSVQKARVGGAAADGAMEEEDEEDEEEDEEAVRLDELLDDLALAEEEERGGALLVSSLSDGEGQGPDLGALLGLGAGSEFAVASGMAGEEEEGGGAFSLGAATGGGKGKAKGKGKDKGKGGGRGR